MRGKRSNFAGQTQTSKVMTYSSEDFERFYLRYKAEAMPRGVSIQAYCSKNKVPFNLFDKWYTDTRHRLVPVQVEGKPENEDTQPPVRTEKEQPITTAPNERLRIMVDLRMTNGMHIQQRNLSYEALKRLILNLEVLC